MSELNKLTPIEDFTLKKILLLSTISILLALTAIISYSNSNAIADSGSFSSNQSTDDVHYRENPVQWYTHTEIRAGDLEIGYNQYGAGMIFREITIPKGSTINSANITFTAERNSSGVVLRSTLCAENIDNASTFNDSASDYLVRYSNITSKVEWDGLSGWTAGNSYTSVNLTFIQTIIDRTGWSSGNNICIFWDDYADESDTGAIRVAESWDTEYADRPQLNIDWTAPASCPDSVSNPAITQGDSGEITVSWTLNTESTDYYELRGGYSSYPSTNTSGFLICTTTSNSYPVNEFYNELDNLYISIFAINETLDCASSATNALYEGGQQMTQAILFAIIFIVVIALTVMMKKNRYVQIGCAFANLGIAYYLMVNLTDSTLALFVVLLPIGLLIANITAVYESKSVN